MREMVLRAAKAIRSKVPEGYGMTGTEAVEYAKAVIEAMREPTNAMLDTGLEALQENLGDMAVIVRDPLFCWRAMIVEALK